MKKRRHGMLSEAAAAHHEAGHAVARYFHGVKVTDASIVPNDYSLGRVRYEKMFRNLQPDIEMSGRARLQIERAIIISLAGLSAQRRYNNKSWRSYHGERDFRYAVDLALQVAGDGGSASAYLKWLQICADELVVCRWPEVARVARALLEHKTMRGGEISDVRRRFGLNSARTYREDEQSKSSKNRTAAEVDKSTRTGAHPGFYGDRALRRAQNAETRIPVASHVRGPTRVHDFC